jgi:hypothetical protein
MSTAASGEYKLGGMTRRAKKGGLVPLLAACAAGVVVTAAAAAVAPATPEAVPAVWVEHEFSFNYMGVGTYYSCDGLAGKVESLLRRLGAREDTHVRPTCPTGPGVDLLAGVRIRAFMPAEATPERLAARAETARDELVARVQGKPAGADAAPVPFPAAWQTISINGRGDRNIDDGDCELMQQIFPQVLEKMGVRMLPDSRLRCSPRTSQRGAVDLRLQSLQKLPEPDAPPAGS